MSPCLDKSHPESDCPNCAPAHLLTVRVPAWVLSDLWMAASISSAREAADEALTAAALALDAAGMVPKAGRWGKGREVRFANQDDCVACPPAKHYPDCRFAKQEVPNGR